MSRILIVEDEPIMRGNLRELFVSHSYDVVEAGSVEEADAKGDLDAFDLVIADVRLPGAAGTTLIPKAKACSTPILVITAYADVKDAVEVMKLGADDYIPKPFDNDELLLVAERLMAQNRRVAALARDVGEVWPVDGMIGSSPAMQKLREYIARVAPTDATVLIGGESGTGKELVARAVHDRSVRRKGPLVAVNCGAIAEGLIVAELFGCEENVIGQRTPARPGYFEDADGGTLFLDEVGELSRDAQSCLLRVLAEGKIRRVGGTQERNVDVRVLAATNRNLVQLVDDGAFRGDLYQRLHGFDIKLLPLRERGGDVEEIALHLVSKAARRFGKSNLHLTPEALAAVRTYHWPYNVRELRNAIERGAILCDTGRITPELLGIDDPEMVSAEERAPVDKSRDANYRRVILTNQARLSETELARLLGITRPGLWRIRRRLGIPRPPPKR